jgi:hypothetical protein
VPADEGKQVETLKKEMQSMISDWLHVQGPWVSVAMFAELQETIRRANREARFTRNPNERKET